MPDLGLTLLPKSFCTKKETEFEKKYRDLPIDGLKALQTCQRLTVQEDTMIGDESLPIFEIGNYTCVQKIQRTNFSVIYTAFDKTVRASTVTDGILCLTLLCDQNGRDVILKRPLIKGDCPVWLQDEVKMLRKCQGSHVVEILDEFIEDGMPYLVLSLFPAATNATANRSRSWKRWIVISFKC